MSKKLILRPPSWRTRLCGSRKEWPTALWKVFLLDTSDEHLSWSEREKSHLLLEITVSQTAKSGFSIAPEARIERAVGVGLLSIIRSAQRLIWKRKGLQQEAPGITQGHPRGLVWSQKKKGKKRRGRRKRGGEPSVELAARGGSARQ